MSVLDSRRYGRPNVMTVSREQFQQILNTPGPDREKMRRETELLIAEALKARDRRIARERVNASVAE